MGNSRLKILIFFFVPVLILFGIGLIFGPPGSSFFGKEPPGILRVPRPHVALPAEPVFHVGSFSITNTLIASWFTMLVLVVLSIFLTRKIRLLPRNRQAMAEVIVEGLLNFVESVAGKKHAKMLFPGVATIFIYVISNAYLALLPFFGSIGIIEHNGKFAPLFRSANTDLNVPLSIALMSFILVESWGMRSVGVVRYLSEFINVGQMAQ